MAGISAFTFTGNSGAAFQSGWSVLAFYFGNLGGLLVNILFLAPWFRQMRATTLPEVIRERFGPITQQVYAYVYMLMFVIMGAIWLLGLAVFSASVFGLPVQFVIPALGCVVVFYSTMGGKWAVLAADFLQGLIMMIMTVVLTILCLKLTGGFDGLLSLISEQGLSQDYKLFNEPGRFPGNAYTWEWGLAAFVVQISYFCSAAGAVKYFSVKDGREARKAAALTFALMLIGIIFWFIPPITARLFFEADVMAMVMPKPEESSFAIVSIRLLPSGLIGLMVVAIISATLSSMDAGLNMNAAMCVRDALPPLRRIIGHPTPPSERAQLHISRAVNVIFGALIVSLAYYFSTRDGLGIFEIMVNFTALVGMPATIPLVLCLFIQKVPAWSALFSLFSGSIVSALSLIQADEWNFQSRTLWVFIAGISSFLFTRLFWNGAGPDYRKQVEGFFTKMHNPVRFTEEVGAANDNRQLKLMGRFTLIIGASIALLLLVPNDSNGRWAILGVIFALFILAGLMLAASTKAAGSGASPEPRARR
jgi:Na+/proline symporter